MQKWIILSLMIVGLCAASYIKYLHNEMQQLVFRLAAVESAVHESADALQSMKQVMDSTDDTLLHWKIAQDAIASIPRELPDDNPDISAWSKMVLPDELYDLLRVHDKSHGTSNSTSGH